MRIPLFPLDIVLFPGASLPLHIFEERYKEMIGECVRGQAEFGIVHAHREGLAVTGCTATVQTVRKRYPDGRMDISCTGRRRFEIESLYDDRSFLEAEVDFPEDRKPDSTRHDRQQCAAFHMEMAELCGEDVLRVPALDLDQPVAYLLASAIPADLGFKQELLQIDSDGLRTRRLMDFYRSILPKLHRGSLVGQEATRTGYVM